MKNKKEVLRIKRHRRILMRMKGLKHRLVVRRSLRHLSGQVIDDTRNKTLFSLSTQNKEVLKKVAGGGSVKAAAAFGEIFAEHLKEKKIDRVVFDRAGYLYHGRIKAFADGLRKAGLQF